MLMLVFAKKKQRIKIMDILFWLYIIAKKTNCFLFSVKYIVSPLRIITPGTLKILSGQPVR